MANIKSSIKRAKTNEKAFMENKAKRTAFAVRFAVRQRHCRGENQEAETLFPNRKAARQGRCWGLIRKNKVANLRSSMARG